MYSAMGNGAHALPHNKSSNNVAKNQANLSRYTEQKLSFNRFVESESVDRQDQDSYQKQNNMNLNFTNRHPHNRKDSSFNNMKQRKVSHIHNVKDVNVHIMDKDNAIVLRKFQCEKKVIIEGM